MMCILQAIDKLSTWMQEKISSSYFFHSLDSLPTIMADALPVVGQEKTVDTMVLQQQQGSDDKDCNAAASEVQADSTASPPSSANGCALRLNELDENLLHSIFSFCEYATLANVLQVNRALRKFLQYDEWLWKDLLSRDFWPELAATSTTEDSTTTVMINDNRQQRRGIKFVVRVKRSNGNEDSEVPSRLFLPPLHNPTAATTIATTETTTTTIPPVINFPLLLSLVEQRKNVMVPMAIQESNIVCHAAFSEIQCANVERNENGNLTVVLVPAEGPKQQPHQQRAYRFSGHCGPSQRCLRANHPFVAPIQLKMYRQDIDLFIERPWKLPFVSPMLLNNKSDQRRHGQSQQLLQEIDITPRWVSYFEISLHPYQPPRPPRETIMEEDNNEAERVINDARARNRRGFQEEWFLRENHHPYEECTAIGLATGRFDSERKMPGWDRHSFGYHGDDGRLYHNTAFLPDGSLPRWPTFGVGDTVGCGLDYRNDGIFFTRNGVFLGYAFELDDTAPKHAPLYPVIGMDANCWVTCNFGRSGADPFVFDVSSMVSLSTINHLMHSLPNCRPWPSLERQAYLWDDSESDDSENSSVGSGSSSGSGSDSGSGSGSSSSDGDEDDDDSSTGSVYNSTDDDNEDDSQTSNDDGNDMDSESEVSYDEVMDGGDSTQPRSSHDQDGD